MSAAVRGFLKAAATIGAAVFIFWTAGAIGLRYTGGASDREPSAMAEGLSPGARRLLDATFEDVVPEALLDHHVHVLGLGTNGTGTWVHPKMLRWSHPVSRVKALAYLSGAHVSDLTRADEQYARLDHVGPDDRRNATHHRVDESDDRHDDNRHFDIDAGDEIDDE